MQKILGVSGVDVKGNEFSWEYQTYEWTLSEKE